MTTPEYPLAKDDVTVEAITDECDECTGTIVGGSYTVAVDFHSAGMTERLGRYCEECAEEIARRIRDGLPASASEPEESATTPPTEHS